MTMSFDELKKIKCEIEQINKTYEIFDENTRLNRTQSARVEFTTNTHYIEKYLHEGARILDIGAGAGEYSLYYAEKGYEVCSLELSDNNIAAFRRKILPQHRIDLKQGNAVDLSCYPDKHFDIVLLMGPLYHMHNESDRQRCILEAKRVCKDNGALFFAFISNDMVILTELGYDNKYFLGNTYNHDSFEVENFPFVFFTMSQCREMLKSGGVDIIHEVASDGMSELMADTINGMDDESYAQYLRYHLYVCEKPEMVGHSNHLLFVGRKKDI